MKLARHAGRSLALVLWLAGCVTQPPPARAAAAESAGGATASAPIETREDSPTTPPIASAAVAPTGMATPPMPPSAEARPLASGGLPGGGDGSGGAGPLATGGGRANYGVRSLNPGFQPDPIDVDVVPGGNLEASTLAIGDGCVGYVSREPDFIVRLTGTSPTLQMYATSGVDTTLLVNDPSGRWHCDDDSYGSHNPRVDLAGAGAGQYDVWVGTFHAGDQATATLHITERGGRP